MQTRLPVKLIVYACIVISAVLVALGCYFNYPSNTPLPQTITEGNT